MARKVSEECVNLTVSADFVYFGCGLHILHLEPERPVYGLIIDRCCARIGE